MGNAGRQKGAVLDWMAVAVNAKHAKWVVRNGSGMAGGVELGSVILQKLMNGTACKVEKRVNEGVFRVLEDWVGLDMSKRSAVAEQLPMLQSPARVLLCIVVYLMIVCFWARYIKREDLKPRRDDSRALSCFVIAHNSLLCGLSLFMGVGIVAAALHYRYSIWGNVYRDDQPAMAYMIYIFYISKLYEFMDTAVMLMKRNLRQMTYLHVYHHASITFIWWIMSYRAPGGDAYFSAAFNSWIHVLMYLYYLLAATVAKDNERRRKYLFWGKYLTMMQMLQFLSFIGQATFGILWPQYHPKGIPRMLLVYSLSLLLFFSNFFLKKHVRNSRKRTKAD